MMQLRSTSSLRETPLARGRMYESHFSIDGLENPWREQVGHGLHHFILRAFHILCHALHHLLHHVCHCTLYYVIRVMHVSY